MAAHAVALAAGPSGPRLTGFTEVAPLALMASSVELLRTWVHETLGQLADDDDQHARLCDTLRVFLEENGSFKATVMPASAAGGRQGQSRMGGGWAASGSGDR